MLTVEIEAPGWRRVVSRPPLDSASKGIDYPPFSFKVNHMISL